jgi:hypothetical protein
MVGTWRGALLALKELRQKDESIWILSVVKDVKMEWDAWKEAFAKTEEPLGWYFAGRLSDGRERVDFYKKSAEGGCSWGQAAYGGYFENGFELAEKDEKIFVEWLEKAAAQKNPRAMDWLGDWFCWDGGNDKEKAVSYYGSGAELGWKGSMLSLAVMRRRGKGCAGDLRQAAIWSAKVSYSYLFWNQLEDARRALESGVTEDLDCDSNQLCYLLGWGLYWYQHGSKEWKSQNYGTRSFGKHCLDFYCACIELQQKSILAFLLFWNRTTGRMKEPGRMIAQMVWEERETNLLLKFGEQTGSILF